MALASCHGSQPVRQINPLHVAHNAMTDHLLTVNMGALRHSNQFGSASMGDESHGVDVAVRLDNEPHGEAEAAYIGRSNCTRPAKVPWKPLHPVVDGKSSTYVPGVTVGDIKSGRYAIVVEDAIHPKTPIACGDFEI